MATVKELETKLEELEAENKQLKEQSEKQPEALVLPDAKFTPTIPYIAKKKVMIELFKDDQRYREPLFVGINGRFMLIQRGVPVEVDDYVADFIEQQKAEEARIMRKVELEEQEYLQNTAALGK
jgi:hypothetical protein